MDESKEILKHAWCVEIGHQIAEARTARNLSQAELAKIVGLPQSHIARIEVGALNPTIGTIGLILSAMAMTMKISKPE